MHRTRGRFGGRHRVVAFKSLAPVVAVVKLRGPSPTPRQMGYRMPAEFESQESVWLVWPRDPKTWPDRVDKARATFVDAIRYITPYQRVDLVVHPDLMADAQRQLKNAGIRNVHFHPVDHQDSWIRDYGPIYIVKDSFQGRQRLATTWKFNAWGNKYDELLKDQGVNKQLGMKLRCKTIPVDMVLEGGSIDSNGDGTILTTEQCLLNPNRNPDMDKAGVEKHLMEYLGANKILWLGEGIAGDDTDGHVDDIARFVWPGVVAAAVEGDKAHPNHKPLADNLERLQHMTDAHGRKLKTVEIPMPEDVMGDDGDVLPASHLNFLITNGVVLLPAFGGPSDEIARLRLQQCFTDRPVTLLDCRDLVWGMGAIHCLSQQMPIGEGSQRW